MTDPEIEIDTDGMSRPICPWCGHAHEDAFEWKDEGDRQCHHCGKLFLCWREVEVTYTTERLVP